MTPCALFRSCHLWGYLWPNTSAARAVVLTMLAGFGIEIPLSFYSMATSCYFILPLCRNYSHEDKLTWNLKWFANSHDPRLPIIFIECQQFELWQYTSLSIAKSLSLFIAKRSLDSTLLVFHCFALNRLFFTPGLIFWINSNQLHLQRTRLKSENRCPVSTDLSVPFIACHLLLIVTWL